VSCCCCSVVGGEDGSCGEEVEDSVDDAAVVESDIDDDVDAISFDKSMSCMCVCVCVILSNHAVVSFLDFVCCFEVYNER
jgi:hypothetical protein